MGADIHGVLQGKVGSKWESFYEIDDDRSYAVFSALAGVRNYNDVTPIAEPRGLPEGFSMDENESVTLRYSNQKIWTGEHSHSWLTLDEILNWDGWSQQLDNGTTLGDACEQFITWAKWAKMRMSYFGARIVFGFDS